MRIRVEPKDFFMYSVFLAFKKEDAEAEDAAVKAYLEQHELMPKMQGTDTVEGEELDVMYFGGCYLGRHLGVIEDMQRKAVEREMLAEEIEGVLRRATDPETRRASDALGAGMGALVAAMAEDLHDESSFGPGDDGYLKVTLEPGAIRDMFLERAARETRE
jgi:hypothetical protein